MFQKFGGGICTRILPHNRYQEGCMTKTHPSNFFEEEYALGVCFNSTNYDETFVGPTWDELLDLLKDEKIKEMYILFCGNVGSDTNRKGGGTGFGLVTQRDIQHVAIALWEEKEKEAKEEWEEAVAEWENLEEDEGETA